MMRVSVYSRPDYLIRSTRTNLIKALADAALFVAEYQILNALEIFLIIGDRLKSFSLAWEDFAAVMLRAVLGHARRFVSSSIIRVRL